MYSKNLVSVMLSHYDTPSLVYRHTCENNISPQLRWWAVMTNLVVVGVGYQHCSLVLDGDTQRVLESGAHSHSIRIAVREQVLQPTRKSSAFGERLVL